MHEETETKRIEAFSDAVFAIAMTLLVTDIKVPRRDLVAADGLVRSLAANWPSYLAFITSLVTILVIWVHHHWIFVLIRRHDHPLLYWNGLLLLFVSFVPFPTALLAEYLSHPEAKVASKLYTGTFLAISLAFAAIWRHARTRLLSTTAPSEQSAEAVQVTKHYRFGPLLYCGVFGVSFVSGTVSVALCFLLALFFALGAGQSKRSLVFDRKQRTR